MFLEMLSTTEKGDVYPHKLRARKKALQLGFPTRKVEAFKYIPLKEMESANFTLLEGGYSLSSSSDQVEILPLDQAMEKYGVLITNRLEKSLDKEQSFFSFVNRGWSKDTFCLFIKGSVDEVIEIEEHFLGDDGMICPQLQFFIVGGASVSLHHKIKISGSGNIINRLVDLSIERGANVTVYETVEVGFDNHLFFHIRGDIKQKASYTHRSGVSGCKLFRNEIRTNLLEKEASCTLEGFWNGSGKDHIHHHVHCSHLAEETISRQHYQGVCDGSARASFEGQIYVDKIAQKTDSYQLSKHLLIGAEARAFSKPNLEVFADDVIASHGATICTLNEEELFYLTSRGIDKEAAALLLKQGFLSFFLDEIKDEKVAKIFKGLIEK